MRVAAMGMLLCITGMAVLEDLRTGKIPNVILVGGEVCAFCFQFFSNGAAGLLIFAGGTVLPLLLLGGLYYFRMIGAGDIKLLCVVGGFLGPADGSACVIASILIAGGISLWILIQRRNAVERMFYFSEYVERYLTTGKWESYMEHTAETARFCFSVPVLLSVIGYIGGIF